MHDIALDELVRSQDFIVFDGECALCTGFFRFMLKRDRAQKFKFVTAQSELGRNLYSDLKLPTQDFETNLVVLNGQVYQRLDAIAAAMQALPGMWPVVSLCKYLPGAIKDPIYHALARNRYAVFGRADTCLVPDQDLMSRFLPKGY